MLLSFVLFMLALLGNHEVLGQEEMLEKLGELFPYCRIGEDQDGAGVYFIPYAAWETGKKAVRGTAKEQEQVYNLLVQEITDTWTADVGTRKKGITVIGDAAGMEIANFFSPGAIQIFLKTFAKNKELAKLIRGGFFVNVAVPPELYGALWKAVLGDMSSRIEVYGPNREVWEPQLQRNIPNNVLLQGYGGTNPIPERCDRKEMRRKVNMLTPESLKSLINQNPLTLAQSLNSVAAGGVGSGSSSLLGTLG